METLDEKNDLQFIRNCIKVWKTAIVSSVTTEVFCDQIDDSKLYKPKNHWLAKIEKYLLYGLVNL